MATHSNILAGESHPWTEEPGELQCTGSQSQTRLKRLSMHACTHAHVGLIIGIDPVPRERCWLQLSRGARDPAKWEPLTKGIQ